MTGSELRAARERLSISQQDLAKALGMTAKRAAQTISDWETGRRGMTPDPVAMVAVRAMLAFGLPDTWPDSGD